MSDPDLELPASLAAAWGVRSRPQKGPRPALSLERIVEAAIGIAAVEGLAAVSMSRVAAALGASTMSLYRYVAAKDELLALMLDVATGLPPQQPDPDGGWRASLSRWAWAERGALRSNPWVVHLQLSGPPITPNQIAWLEQGLWCMRDTGLTPAEKLAVIMMLTGYIWRESELAIDIEAAMAADSKWLRMLVSYGQTLSRLADRERYPQVMALIEAGTFDVVDEPDADFTFALDRILDGIEALVESRRARPTEGASSGSPGARGAD